MVAHLLGLLTALFFFFLVLFLAVLHPHCCRAFLYSAERGSSRTEGLGSSLQQPPLVQSLGSGWVGISSRGSQL